MTDMHDDIPAGSRCGYVAIVGRPNVGKSTLLNHILGQKLAITSRKPQTTRHNMLGIKTEGEVQAVYVDTPGLHKSGEKALNRYMNRTASAALKDVDVVIFVVDRTRWTEEDQMVLERVQYVSCPVLIAVNKTDRIEEKADLLPHLEWLTQQLPKAEIVPISAQHGTNLDVLEKLVAERLPESEHFFPEDQITDRSSRFLAAELVREKIMRQLGAELPYQITVEIEEFKQEGRILHIHALILVEREGQKKIIIGDKGERIKASARTRAKTWKCCSTPRSCSTSGSRSRAAGPTTSVPCARWATATSDRSRQPGASRATFLSRPVDPPCPSPPPKPPTCCIAGRTRKPAPWWISSPRWVACARSCAAPAARLAPWRGHSCRWKRSGAGAAN